MPDDPQTDRYAEVVLARHSGTSAQRRTDRVAREEPLEISLDGAVLAVVMRTPGDDEDLAVGFLLTEGILLAPTEVAAIRSRESGRLEVQLADGVKVDSERFKRNLFVSSSCGVCGKASIETVNLLAPPARPFQVRREVVAGLTTRLRRHQPTFDETGGLHAVGVFDLEGEPLTVREDIGRHNAADKAIGAAAARRWPLAPAILTVSGRQSFEIVQKAAMAGIGAVVGVSAPSSLAVELATSLDMLLVGFARGETFNVYAGAHHLVD